MPLGNNYGNPFEEEQENINIESQFGNPFEEEGTDTGGVKEVEGVEFHQRNKFGGTFGDIIDLLQRGEYVSAGVAKNTLDTIFKGEQFNPIGNIKAGITGKNMASYQDIIEEYQPRLTNESNQDINAYSFDYSKPLQTAKQIGQTVIDEVPSRTEDMIRFAEGLAGDIFLDPINFLGIGLADDFITKIDDVIKVVGDLNKYDDPVQEIIETGVKMGRWERGSDLAKQVKEVAEKQGVDFLQKGSDLAEQGYKGQRPLINIGGQKLVPDVVSGKTYEIGGDIFRKADDVIPGTNEFRKLFSTNTGEKEIDDLLEMTQKQYNKEVNIDIPRQIQDLKTKIDDASLETDEGLQKISYMVEKPNSIDNIDDIKVKNIVDDLKTRQTEMAKVEKELGVPLQKMSSDDVDYFMHLLTDEAKDKIGKVKGEGKLKSIIDEITSALQHGSTKGRVYQDMSIEEINKLARKGELPGYEGVKINKFFETDPIKIQTIRELRHAKAKKAGTFLNEVKTKFGVDEAKEGFRQIKVPNSKYADVLDDTYVPNEIADYLESYIRKTEDLASGNLDKFLKKVYDPYLRLWKQTKLLPIPGFHARNFADNFFKNYLGDVNPNSYNDLLKILADDSYTITTKGGKKFTGKELIEIAQKEGIINKGFASVQIKGDITEQVLKGQSILGTNIKSSLDKNPARAVLNLGGEAGKANENFFRLTHFIDKVKKGNSFSDASKSTFKYLFDYGDFTEFEQKVMKRIMPFYAFTRFNIPLQLEMLLTKPGKISTLGKIKQNIEDEDLVTPDEKFQAEWQKESPKIWFGDDFYMNLANYASAFDLLQLNEPAQSVAGMLTPPLKDFITSSTGVMPFSRDELERYEGEPTEVFGKVIPQKTEWKIRNYIPGSRLAGEIDALNPNNVFGGDQQRPYQSSEALRWLDFLAGINTQEFDEQMGVQSWQSDFESGTWQRLWDLIDQQKKGNEQGVDYMERLLQEYFQQNLNN